MSRLLQLDVVVAAAAAAAAVVTVVCKRTLPSFPAAKVRGPWLMYLRRTIVIISGS